MSEPPRVTNRRSTSYVRLFVQVAAVLIAAIGGWLGWVLYTAKVQHDAVIAIEKAGGSVSYDWNLRDGPLVPTPKPWWLKWLVDLLGADCFTNVISVRLGERGSDAELAQAGTFRSLDSLDAAGSSITDAGLNHLKKLPQLSGLNLSDTAITDAGLTDLGGLADLQRLELYRTRVTDEGLAHLDRLKSLHYLGLAKTRVTDAGLVHLLGLTNLRHLNIWGTDATKAGVQDLKRSLPRLE